MPSKWSVGKRGGTNDWMVYKNDTPHGRPHANQQQAESARKNFEQDERQKEAEEAKKKKGGK